MQLKSFIGTVVGCVALVIICAPIHGGITLLFVVPFLAVWLIYSAYVIWRNPARRNTQSIKAGTWILTVFGVLLVHWHYYNAARNDANFVATSILRYKTAHGSYPQNLDAINLRNYGRKWMLGYILDKGEPGLFYGATFVPFDTYFYDFEKRSWVYQPD